MVDLWREFLFFCSSYFYVRRVLSSPGLVSYGSDLGLSHIAMESSTSDGPAPDPLSANPPATLGDTVIRAVDGLVFESRNAL